MLLECWIPRLGEISTDTMEVPFWTVDSFTRQPFSGNPAAVCLLETDLSDEEKQQIATEMNISETCYVTKVTGDHLHCLLERFE